MKRDEDDGAITPINPNDVDTFSGRSLTRLRVDYELGSENLMYSSVYRDFGRWRAVADFRTRDRIFKYASQQLHDDLSDAKNLANQLVDELATTLGLRTAFNVRGSLLSSAFEKLAEAASNGTNRDKQLALEGLVAELFASFDGWSVSGRNVRTGNHEIDILFRNANTAHPLLSKMGTAVPTECKCVSTPVASRDLEVFAAVLHDMRSPYGLFVTTAYITGSKFEGLRDSRLVLRDAFRDGFSIFVFDGSDLEAIRAGRSLLELLWLKDEALRTL